MGTGEDPLRRRFCRGAGCGVVFWICRHCDRATNTAATAGSVPAVPRKPLPLHQLVYFCSAEVVQIYSALDTPPGIWPWPPCVTSSTPW